MKVLIATASTADDRKTLAAVRSLGRSGAWVAVGGDSLWAAPFRSRFCREKVVYPSPSRDKPAFLDRLRQVVSSGRYDVLLPLCDYTTFPIAAHQEELSRHVRVPVPEYAALTRAHDKWEVLAVARSVGIATPESYCPRDMEEVRSIAEEVTYPCVFKLRRGAGGIGLRYAASADDLIRCYHALPGTADAVIDRACPVIQEYIPGETHDVCLLFNRGEARAALTQRRVLTHPPDGGVGVVNRTTRDLPLRDLAITLLEALEWHGPAQLEFRRDARDGRMKLIDFNARYWGTLDVSIQAGVNFPLLACRMALEGEIECVFDYEVGLRYRWPFPHAFQHPLRSRQKWRSLCHFFNPSPRIKSDLWITDLWPHVGAVFDFKKHRETSMNPMDQKLPEWQVSQDRL